MLGQKVNYKGQEMFVVSCTSGFGSQDSVELVIDRNTHKGKIEVLLTELPELKDLEGRIVTWANYGEHIPVKCQKCGAIFTTKNINRIGARSIFPSLSYGEKDNFIKTSECDNAGHSADDLIPDREAYETREL